MKPKATDNLKSIANTISKRLPELKRDYSLRRIGIFGSYSTGRQSSTSKNSDSLFYLPVTP
jgi:predicted nucleotidyltransferase